MPCRPAPTMARLYLGLKRTHEKTPGQEPDRRLCPPLGEGRFDQGEIHRPGEIEGEGEALARLLVVDKVDEERAAGAAGLAHVASGKYYFPILQQVTLLDY